MDIHGKQNRKSNPRHAREIGEQHARLTGFTVTRDAVVAWSPGWTDDEVDAYLEGRAETTQRDN